MLIHSFAHTRPVHKDLQARFQKLLLHHRRDYQTKAAAETNEEIIDASADLGHVSVNI